MAIHPANFYPDPEQHQPYAPPELGVLQSVHERAKERWAVQEQTPEATTVDKRDEMRRNFYEYCGEFAQVDPHSDTPEDEPKLANAIHTYVTRVVHKRARDIDTQHRSEQPNTPERILTIPTEPIARRISSYYQRYGVNRHHAYAELRDKAERFLEITKRAVYANVMSSGKPDEQGNPTEPSRIPRAVMYPEIGVVQQLRDTLIDDDARLAADAAEVVLAAYGERFLTLARHANVIVQSDTGSRLIKRSWDAQEIPFDQQAEAYSPRSPRP